MHEVLTNGFSLKDLMIKYEAKKIFGKPPATETKRNQEHKEKREPIQLIALLKTLKNCLYEEAWSKLQSCWYLGCKKLFCSNYDQHC